VSPWLARSKRARPQQPGQIDTAATMDAADPLPSAFLYTLPLFEMARTRYAAVGGAQGTGRGRVNRLGHRRTLSDHQARSVTTPNNDTLYSSAWIDVEGGPLVLRVPRITNRYWSIQFLDIFTNNAEIVSAGHHGPAADGDELRLWIAHADDTTAAPAGHRVVRLPGRDCWMLVRIEVRSDEELAQVHAIQDAMVLSVPPSNKGLSGEVVGVQGTGRPRDGAEYLAVVNNMLLRNGVPKAEAQMVAQWRSLGIGSAPPQWDAAAVQEWTRRLPELYASLAPTPQADEKGAGGWALPDPAVGDFGTHYVLRARVAHEALAALPAREAIYFVARTDAQGRPLDASARYRLQVPVGGFPTDAFWSVSMYQVEQDGKLFFTENPLRRYALGSRATGVVRNDDGSFDIAMQRDMPTDPRKRANWLPTPGPGHPRFQVVLRVYLPKPQLLQRLDTLPPIRRVD
jgi:hypothetical protein